MDKRHIARPICVLRFFGEVLLVQYVKIENVRTRNHRSVEGPDFQDRSDILEHRYEASAKRSLGGLPPFLTAMKFEMLE